MKGDGYRKKRQNGRMREKVENRVVKCVWEEGRAGGSKEK